METIIVYYPAIDEYRLWNISGPRPENFVCVVSEQYKQEIEADLELGSQDIIRAFVEAQ